MKLWQVSGVMGAYMTPFDHIPLAEPAGQILTIYSDCIGSIEIIQPGVNLRVTYVELRKIGGMVYRVPILEMVRPRIWSDQRYWHLLMARAQGQSTMDIAAAH